MTAPDHMPKLFKTDLHYRGHPHMSSRTNKNAPYERQVAVPPSHKNDEIGHAFLAVLSYRIR